MFHHKHNRRIGVPRGLLLHITMVLLKEGPKSGSELTELINEYTEWKPSPGSMYPLLNKLRKDGLIAPHEDEDSALKRFEITEKGNEQLEAHIADRPEFKRRNRAVMKMRMILRKGMPMDVFDSFGGLIEEMEDTWDSLDESNVTLFTEILDNTRAELKKIGKKQDE